MCYHIPGILIYNAFGSFTHKWKTLLLGIFNDDKEGRCEEGTKLNHGWTISEFGVSYSYCGNR